MTLMELYRGKLMDLKKIKSLYINEIIWMKKFLKKLDFGIYFFC